MSMIADVVHPQPRKGKASGMWHVSEDKAIPGCFAPTGHKGYLSKIIDLCLHKRAQQEIKITDEMISIPRKGKASGIRHVSEDKAIPGCFAPTGLKGYLSAISG